MIGTYEFTVKFFSNDEAVKFIKSKGVRLAQIKTKLNIR